MTCPRILVASVLAAALAGCAPTTEQFLRSQEPTTARLVAIRTVTVASASDAMPLAAGASDSEAAASDTTATAQIGHLAVSADWIGQARPLVTGYDLIGRVNRFVIPYTRQTWLVQLRIRNDGPMPQRIRASDWELNVEPGHLKRQPLELAFFKERWPSVAVRSEAMMLDQAMAIGQVIRTLWGDRTIEPGETVTGILPFLASPEAPKTARLTWKAAPQPLTLEFGEAP